MKELLEAFGIAVAYVMVILFFLALFIASIGLGIGLATRAFLWAVGM